MNFVNQTTIFAMVCLTVKITFQLPINNFQLPYFILFKPTIIFNFESSKFRGRKQINNEKQT